VTLSSKGAKSQSRVRGLRSTRTKARTHVGRAREPRAELEKKLEARTRELTEARTQLAEARERLVEAVEQQTAASDVLKVISRSTFDLQAVFDTLIESAARLCEADNALLWRRDGEFCRVVANHVYSREFEEYLKQHPVPVGRGSLAGRTALEGKIVHIPDVLADPEYTMTEAIKRAPYRTMLGVPLLRVGNPIGLIALTRATVRPFSDKQIELVETFAHQAVIAIENTRLLNELRESLEQQTATSEVLRVISGSPGELEPVFSTMLGNAVRICEAKFGTLYLCEGDGFRAVAMHNAPPAYAEARAAVVHPPPDSSLGWAAKTKEAAQVADVTKLPSYIAGDPFVISAVERGGYRTVLTVPMLKEDELIGAITIHRQEVRPFADKQIELVTNFANQAVIAIDNARLLSELRQRTDDLSEALEQQTRHRGCSKSSAARRASLSRCLKPCSRMPCTFARPSSGSWYFVRTECSVMSQRMAYRLPMLNTVGESRWFGLLPHPFVGSPIPSR
jgi:GAF domain-containing protein